MSHEITNQVIELSADELEVVAGGAGLLDEEAIFAVNKTSLVSGLSVGAGGVTSVTATDSLDIFSAASKKLAVF
jgi:hypothetical protein